MWEIKNQWSDDQYNYIEYTNGTIIQSVKGVATSNVQITLPPSMEERLSSVEAAITTLMGV